VSTDRLHAEAVHQSAPPAAGARQFLTRASHWPLPVARLPRRLWTRLTVLFVCLFLVTTTAVVVLALVIANQQFSNSVDDQILGTATAVEDRIKAGGDPQTSVNELATPSQWLELLDANGAVTLRSGNLVGFTLPTYLNPPKQLPNDGLHTLRRRGSVIRMIRHPLKDESGGVTGYVIVAGIVASTGESTFDLGMILGAAAAVGLLAVIAGTIWLSRREAAPLRGLADEVRTAAAAGFAHAIPATGGGSLEAQELRAAISTLVDRQRDVIERERAFFADSSHVLRTPLAVLKGDVEMLQQGVFGTERHEVVAQAENAIDTMSRTISGLLLLARDQNDLAASWEVIDLAALLSRLVGEAAVAHPELKVRLTQPTGPVEVAGDGHQLRDLFTALIENACQYTPAGGEVTVSVDALDAIVKVSVRDTGIGFSADELHHATDRFFRGLQARRIFPGGSGLGLAIAAQIVKLHRGELSLERNEPQGATVLVRLQALE
jgi:signal transduction histidine kinase